MKRWLSLAAVVGLAVAASWGCGPREEPTVDKEKSTAVGEPSEKPTKSLTEAPDDTSGDPPNNTPVDTPDDAPDDTPDDTDAALTAKTPSEPPPPARWPDDPGTPVTVTLLGTVDQLGDLRWPSTDGVLDSHFGSQTRCQLTVGLPGGGKFTLPVRGTLIMQQRDTVVRDIQAWPAEKPGALSDVVAAVLKIIEDNKVRLDDEAQAVVEEWKTAAADKAAPKTTQFEVALDEQFTLELHIMKVGSDEWVYDLDLEADGDALADKIHEVAAAWCLKPAFVLEGVGQRAFFSPDSKFLTTGTHLWDIETKAKVGELKSDGQPGYVRHVRFSSDGTQLAVVHERAVRIWDMESKELVKETTAEKTTFGAISPDFGRVLAFTEDKGVEVWSVEKGAQEVSLEWEKRDAGVSGFSATDRILLSPRHGGEMAVWDAKSGKQLFVCTPTGGSSGWPYNGAFTNDGKTLLSGTSQAIDAYDMGNGNHLFRINTWASHCLAISADDKYLAGGTWASQGVESVEVFDMATQKRIAELGKLRKPIHTVDFSPDGRWLAAALNDRSVPVWDMSGVAAQK